MAPAAEVRRSLMAIRSRRGVALGLASSLVVPVFALVASWLVEANVWSGATLRPSLDAFGTLAWASLGVLGPVGIVVTGWSAGIPDRLTWIAWLVVTIPAFVVLWFVGVASLSGALGNPF